MPLNLNDSQIRQLKEENEDLRKQNAELNQQHNDAIDTVVMMTNERDKELEALRKRVAEVGGRL